MKIIYFFIALLSVACNSAKQENKKNANPDTTQTTSDQPNVPPPALKTHSNERFRYVTVQRTGDYTFLVQGKAQVFEANFGWVVEDGHNELKNGFQMTDAGAPEWGNFSFSIDVKKDRPNSTLILILFESSPKDGSRQHELPIELY